MASSTFVITNNKGETISIPLDKLISVFGSASAPTPAPTSTHTMDISSDEEPIRSNPKRRRLARNKSSMECVVLKCKKIAGKGGKCTKHKKTIICEAPQCKRVGYNNQSICYEHRFNGYRCLIINCTEKSVFNGLCKVHENSGVNYDKICCVKDCDLNPIGSHGKCIVHVKPLKPLPCTRD